MKILLAICLFFSTGLVAQPLADADPELLTYVSKTKAYQIEYNAEHWQIDTGPTEWDVEFHDSHNILKAYFGDFNFFIPENRLKSSLKTRFKKIGKVKNLKTYKKKLNHMEVDYFECEVKFKGYMYRYQGFIFAGQYGSMELQFGGQEESIYRNQSLIDELCNGVVEVKE